MDFIFSLLFTIIPCVRYDSSKTDIELQALYTTRVPLFKPYASPHRKTLQLRL